MFPVVQYTLPRGLTTRGLGSGAPLHTRAGYTTSSCPTGPSSYSHGRRGGGGLLVMDFSSPPLSPPSPGPARGWRRGGGLLDLDNFSLMMNVSTLRLNYRSRGAPHPTLFKYLTLNHTPHPTFSPKFEYLKRIIKIYQINNNFQKLENLFSQNYKNVFFYKL